MSWIRAIGDLLGLNGTRLQWRLIRFQESIRRRLANAGNRSRRVTFRNKLCTRCRALVDTSEPSCPRCGAHVLPRSVTRLGQLIDFVAPKHAPMITLLVISCAVFFVIPLFWSGPSALMLPNRTDLTRLGALVPELVFYRNDWHRLITYGFLHANLIHIGFNLTALIQIGPFLEEEIGSARLFVVYMVSLIGAGLADTWLRLTTMTYIVGASGAVFGLIGFSIIYGQFSGRRGLELRNMMLRWALFGLGFGFLVPGIDNIAHIGGCLSGMAVALPIALRPQRDHGLWRFIAVVLLLTSVVAFAVLFYRQPGRP